MLKIPLGCGKSLFFLGSLFLWLSFLVLPNADLTGILSLASTSAKFRCDFLH